MFICTVCISTSAFLHKLALYKTYRIMLKQFISIDFIHRCRFHFRILFFISFKELLSIFAVLLYNRVYCFFIIDRFARLFSIVWFCKPVKLFIWILNLFTFRIIGFWFLDCFDLLFLNLLFNNRWFLDCFDLSCYFMSSWFLNLLFNNRWFLGWFSLCCHLMSSWFLNLLGLNSRILDIIKNIWFLNMLNFVIVFIKLLFLF